MIASENLLLRFGCLLAWSRTEGDRQAGRRKGTVDSRRIEALDT